MSNSVSNLIAKSATKEELALIRKTIESLEEAVRAIEAMPAEGYVVGFELYGVYKDEANPRRLVMLHRATVYNSYTEARHASTGFRNGVGVYSSVFKVRDRQGAEIRQLKKAIQNWNEGLRLVTEQP